MTLWQKIAARNGDCYHKNRRKKKPNYVRTSSGVHEERKKMGICPLTAQNTDAVKADAEARS